jgi:hypothetical protein
MPTSALTDAGLCGAWQVLESSASQLSELHAAVSSGGWVTVKALFPTIVRELSPYLALDPASLTGHPTEGFVTSIAAAVHEAVNAAGTLGMAPNQASPSGAVADGLAQLAAATQDIATAHAEYDSLKQAGSISC